MKHIRKFNESIEQSDLLDIEDLFKEIADEWNLGKMDGEELTILFDNLLSGQTRDDRSIKNTYSISLLQDRIVQLTICLDVIGEWHTTSSDKFTDSIIHFINRCEGIGYTVKYKYEYDPIKMIKIHFW